jgi:serine/threonine protein phosphatase 1
MAMFRRPLTFDGWPAVVYAIGDVHGCLPQLLELEQRIAADAASIEGEKWLVMLGDYIDRGPYSAQVIEHLLQPPPPGFMRWNLAGNHEQMMLDFLADPAANAFWLDQGGAETLSSYGVAGAYRYLDAPLGNGFMALVAEQVPAAHIRFMRELVTGISLPGWFFVHAGIRPGAPLAAQTEEDLIWIREPFLHARLLKGLRVVHGHTPEREPVVTAHRIGIDTQCFATGRLTAVRVTEDGEVGFLSATA